MGDFQAGPYVVIRESNGFGVDAMHGAPPQNLMFPLHRKTTWQLLPLLENALLLVVVDARLIDRPDFRSCNLCAAPVFRRFHADFMF